MDVMRLEVEPEGELGVEERTFDPPVIHRALPLLLRRQEMKGGSKYREQLQVTPVKVLHNNKPRKGSAQERR